jgi:LuxR family quorum-sensing system transcriptional regulator CciR
MRHSRLIRDFKDLVDTAADDNALRMLIEEVARELGFEYMAVVHLVSLIRRAPRLIRYENYPPGWDRRLIGRGHRIIDPILSIARRRSSTLRWPDDLNGVRLTAHQRAILTEANRLGIRQGITIPANVPGEPEGSISFASARTRTIGKERLLIVDSIGRLSFDAARRLAGFSPLSNLVPDISDRERECIYWIARGKTDQDIADILGIKLETVRTYVKKAFRRLGVITRAQLVYEAVRLNLIDFVPSIPPYG